MKLTKVATPYFLGGRYFIGYLTVFPYLGNGPTGTFWSCHAMPVPRSLAFLVGEGGGGMGEGEGEGEVTCPARTRQAQVQAQAQAQAGAARR